jgi:hypothetical protein
MGSTYELIDKNSRDWIETQRMFFVGTATLSASGQSTHPITNR